MGGVTVATPPKGEASLLVLLLEEMLVDHLTNPALVAALDAAAPVVAVQGGTSTATLRFGGGRVELENGIADDAWLEVRGDVDAFLKMATLDDPVRPLVSGRVRLRPRSGILGGIAGLPLRVVRRGAGLLGGNGGNEDGGAR